MRQRIGGAYTWAPRARQGPDSGCGSWFRTCPSLTTPPRRNAPLPMYARCPGLHRLHGPAFLRRPNPRHRPDRHPRPEKPSPGPQGTDTRKRSAHGSAWMLRINGTGSKQDDPIGLCNQAAVRRAKGRDSICVVLRARLRTLVWATGNLCATPGDRHTGRS